MSFNIKKLQNKKIFISTPMNRGRCMGLYHESVCSLVRFLSSNKIPFEIKNVMNEPLIDRARNIAVYEFLKTDCTHMMFIDSDLQFDYRDVITLLGLIDKKPYDVLGGAYPLKKLPIEYNGNLIDIDKPFNKNEVSEALEIGTGFMMIRRETFEKLIMLQSENYFMADYSTYHGKKIYNFFECVIDENSKRYLSEDFTFCRKVRQIGKVWICPWMEIYHIGFFKYGTGLTKY